MFQTHTIVAEIRRTLVLAVPLIGAQLLQMGNGLVDAVVAGRLGRAELAAGGLGASIWFFVSLLCIGIMAGLSPILSELIGNRRRNYVGEVFRQGLWLALIVGSVACALILLIAAFLHLSPLEPELIPLVRQYLYTSCWSMPALALVLASRNVCEATGLTRPVLLVQLMGLLVNIVIDLTFGLGLFGFPQWGLVGIGMATSLVTITMAVVLIRFLFAAEFKRYNLFAKLEPPKWMHIKPILLLAVPIFFGLLFEAGLFVATAIQAGILGTLEASVHFIAIGATSFCFMLPLGLSFALTARVGRVFGRQSEQSLRLRLLAGILLTVMMALTTALLLVLLRHPITKVYTPDVEVQIFAAKLMLVAALFQLSDAIQVTYIGMLRGLHDTRIPMLINLFAYWGVAFGVGYYAAHHLGYGVYGLWAGLLIGLTIAALLLSWRLRYKSRQLIGIWRLAKH